MTTDRAQRVAAAAAALIEVAAAHFQTVNLRLEVEHHAVGCPRCAGKTYRAQVGHLSGSYSVFALGVDQESALDELREVIKGMPPHARGGLYYEPAEPTA